MPSKPLKKLEVPIDIQELIEEQYHYRLDHVSPKKAEEFKEEIAGAFRQIKAHPLRWSSWEEFRRYGPTKIFKYIVYYEYSEEDHSAIIAAVAHYAQDPFGLASSDEDEA